MNRFRQRSNNPYPTRWTNTPALQNLLDGISRALWSTRRSDCQSKKNWKEVKPVPDAEVS